jgi:hypothetical protein
LALLIEAVTEAAHLNTCRGIKATDGVFNPTPLQVRDEFFIGQVL